MSAGGERKHKFKKVRGGKERENGGNIRTHREVNPLNSKSPSQNSLLDFENPGDVGKGDGGKPQGEFGVQGKSCILCEMICLLLVDEAIGSRPNHFRKGRELIGLGYFTRGQLVSLSKHWADMDDHGVMLLRGMLAVVQTAIIEQAGRGKEAGPLSGLPATQSGLLGRRPSCKSVRVSCPLLGRPTSCTKETISEYLSSWGEWGGVALCVC